MKTSRSVIAVVMLAFLLALPPILGPKPAQTAGAASTRSPARSMPAAITVTTTEDELNDDGDCSLREAIQAANTDTAVDDCPMGNGLDTISLPADTYTLSIPSTNEDANLDGDLDIASNVILQGAGTATTIIQAGTTWQNGIDRVLQVLAGSQVTVTNVTIQYGLATGDEPHNRGGGIYNDGGTVTVTDCTLYFNQADGNTAIYGGGIYNNGGTVTVVNSTLDHNRVDCSGGGRGGGIYNNNGELTVDHTVLYHNLVQNGFNGYGGGIYVAGGTVTITHSTLDDNKVWGENAADGGAIHNSGGTVLLTRSTLSNNRSVGTMGGGFGGGIYNRNGGIVTITASILRGNIAEGAEWGAGHGGGIYTSPDGTVTLTNSTLSGNTAANSNRRDPGKGGGIYNNGGTVTLNLSTFSENQAPIGGGIYNDGLVNATNSIIAGNIGTDCSGWISSFDYNIDGDSTCGLTGPHDWSDLDPLLQPLADNGGPTWTYALQGGSLALDGGDCRFGTITQDQRGTARPQGVACDIGAFEHADAVLSVDDKYYVPEDSTLTVAAPGVLLNDWGAHPLTATLILSPTKGTLLLNLDGSFVYTPSSNFYGTDGFTYRASDGPLTDMATATIRVTPVNDAPVATEDTYTTTAGVALTVLAPGVLENDSDLEADSLAAVIKTPPLSGTVTLNPDGSFVYTPTAGFVGVDRFEYSADDGSDDSPLATVTIHVLWNRLYLPFIVTTHQP